MLCFHSDTIKIKLSQFILYLNFELMVFSTL
nr:MAG TPA: hypothetical protein [Caudoviricetes sp.]